MKYTGFKCGREPLNVGDILSYYQGNLGYFEVVERPDGFWLTDCSGKIMHDMPYLFVKSSVCPMEANLSLIYLNAIINPDIMGVDKK
jgi:hypothetical protein